MGRLRRKNRHLPERLHVKNGNYYWTPFVDGKMKWKPLGNDYLRALMQYRELEGLNDGAPTVAKLLDRALAHMANDLKPSTYKEYTRASANLKIAFERFVPSEVEPRHIAEYLEKRERKLADGTKVAARVTGNREMAFFSTAWELARRRGWINLPNPARGVRRNKERQRKRTATAEEIALLLGQDDRMADMVEITLMTAIREDDLLNIHLKQIERDGFRVKPRKTDASTEVEQLFLWTPELKAVFDRARARRRRVGSVFLFPIERGEEAGQAYTVLSFQNNWRRYYAKCGVSGLTWHDLRRTALNMREKAEGKDAAQKLAAHSSVTTTEGYLRGVGAVELLPVKLAR